MAKDYINNSNIPNYYWLAMVFLTLLVAFSFQGSRGLYETSEGRYAECAREMVETGNYIEPTLNYRHHWTKPPLTYWAIAEGIKLLGPNEWGVRLYNSVAFSLTVLSVSYIGICLWGETAGILAGMIYLSSPFPVFGANIVTTDTLLTLWEIMAILCYIKAYQYISSRWHEHLILAMWIFFGLGFLTKGPVALLPLLSIFVWNARQKPRAKLFNPLGIVLFILIGLTWYTVVCIYHPGLLSYFLEKEVESRVIGNSVHNRAWYKSFTVYLPVLTFGAGPWLYFGLRIFRQKKLYIPKNIWINLRNNNSETFLLLWFLIPLAIFCLAKSKLPLYVLPLYAPLALAVARGVGEEKEKTNLSKITVLATVTGFMILIIKGISPYIPHKHNMKHLYKMCCKVKQNNTKFFVFNEPKLYGLQFYLNGKLKRISVTGKEPWADGSVRGVLSEVKRQISPASYVLISTKRKTPTLGYILRKSGLHFERLDSRYWVLFLIKRDNDSIEQALNSKSALGE
jgi:4-amino-4-deoxy-L-arabinose transferase